METNLVGRLRNTSLAYSRGLSPLFEAVVNSIHAIEDAGLSTADGNVAVEILRDPQSDLVFESDDKKRGPEPLGEIQGFKITDNGIGFTEENMQSFCTLDSDYKGDRGGRGVGRLLWLKAFNRVSVSSIYGNGSGSSKSRAFVFNATHGITGEVVSDAVTGATRMTCVHLDGFATKYREATRKSAKAIAANLFEHCLWYFVRPGGAPRIVIADDSESIDLNDIYDEHMIGSAKTERITVGKSTFDLTHVRLRANSSQTHVIAFCAAKRLVKEESLAGKLPGLGSKLADGEGEFVYACYVTSEYLDERVRPERASFDIDDDPVAGMFADGELSFHAIRGAVIEKVSEYLTEYIEDAKEKGIERVQAFVAEKAPQYRPVLGRFIEKGLSVDASIGDKDLEIVLHRHLASVEEEMLAAGQDLMVPRDDEGIFEYEKRLQAYLTAAEDIKRSDLAKYVSHRRVILDIFKKAIERKPDGRYSREDTLHSLIMPMHCDSNEIMPDGCNLWLIDERLAFHEYLASDKSLQSQPITGSADEGRPDINALNVFDNPMLVSETNDLPLASIVVVEMKRPVRDDATAGVSKDPIEQALAYLNRIRRGGVTTAAGRPIPHSESIPGYCYVICDITQSVEERCVFHGLHKTSDGTGYFFYHDNYKAYVEVMSFDGLVNAAKQRNRAFFAKLGLPAT